MLHKYILITLEWEASIGRKLHWGKTWDLREILLVSTTLVVLIFISELSAIGEFSDLLRVTLQVLGSLSGKAQAAFREERSL